jgi:hypothetical protein
MLAFRVLIAVLLLFPKKLRFPRELWYLEAVCCVPPEDFIGLASMMWHPRELEYPQDVMYELRSPREPWFLQVLWLWEKELYWPFDILVELWFQKELKYFV